MDCSGTCVEQNQAVQARISDNAKLLEQGLALLAELSNDDFAAISPLGASVGGHFRHILDFYACFLKGISASTIDYDQRERDSGVESSRELCLQAARTLLAGLQALSLSAETALRVKAEASAPALFAISSVERELQFLSAHTVHHFALISYVLTERGLKVPAGFGMAPSTLEHLRTESLAG
jgi:uncharacterized damage-inducible protein DinB